MNKATSICAGIILIIGIGGFVYSQKVSTFEASVQDMTPVKENAVGVNQGSNQNAQNAATSTAQVVASGISSADVAKHNSRASCWSTINGNVYDLTSWIPQHPGGEQAILRLCGVDGSNAYNGQHNGSEKTTMIIAGFKIGAAANERL